MIFIKYFFFWIGMTFVIGSILGVSSYVICLAEGYSIKGALVFWWCFVGAISLVSIFLVAMGVAPAQLKL